MEVPRWAAPCRTSPAERTQALGWFLQLMLILLSCACWGCHLHRLPHPAHRNGLGPQNSGKSRDKAGDSSTAVPKGTCHSHITGFAGARSQTDNVRAMWHQGGDNAAPREAGVSSPHCQGKAAAHLQTGGASWQPQGTPGRWHMCMLMGISFLLPPTIGWGGWGWCLTLIDPTWWVQITGRTLQGTAYVKSQFWTINWFQARLSAGFEGH